LATCLSHSVTGTLTTRQPRASSIRLRRRVDPLGTVGALLRKQVEQPVVYQVLAAGTRAARQLADRIKHLQLRVGWLQLRKRMLSTTSTIRRPRC
jgi:hypothetical protein